MKRIPPFPGGGGKTGFASKSIIEGVTGNGRAFFVFRSFDQSTGA
jgi:hypothetical protein